MVSTFTANINIEEPARGDDVGTWDTPVNNNSTLLDLVAGGIATIALNNAPVVLAAAQFQSNGITFNSTLTGSCAITFPSTFKKSYLIRNACTGSSAFIVTCGTTVAGGQVIGLPPGESVDVVNDGTNLYFHNLDRIGSYWDYAGSSVPAWNSACTLPPYLNCDGTAIPAAYTLLPIILGSSLLPDSRGRFRATLNQGTARINSSAITGGLDGNTKLAGGGADTTTLLTPNLPPYTPSGTYSIPIQGYAGSPGSPVVTSVSQGANNGGLNPLVNPIVGLAQGGLSTPFSNEPPSFVGGLTLIRAG